MSSPGNEGCTLTGALSVTAEVGNSITVIHGPAGCAHHNFSLLHAFRLARDMTGVPTVISSDLSEKEIVFGGEEALEETIRAAVLKKPDIIFVMTTCVAAAIGDDVAAVCAEDWEIPVCHVSTGGFLGGGFYSGSMEALLALSPFTEPGEGTGSANLVGEKGLEYEVDEHCREVSRLLSLLGIPVNLRYVCHTSLPAIRRFGLGSINILRDPSVSPVGNHFESRFKVPFVDSFPVGLEGTLRFLEAVGEQMDIIPDEAVASEERLQNRLMEKFSSLKGKAVQFSGSPFSDADDSFTMELLEALDMDLDARGAPVPLPDPFPVGTTGIERLLHRWRRCCHA